jgi:hypothetical protein
MESRPFSLLSSLAGIILFFTLSSNGVCGIVLHKQIYRVIPGRGRTQLLQSWKEYYQDNKVAVYQNNAVFITDISTNKLINIIPSKKIYAVNDIDEFIRKIKNIIQQIKAQQSETLSKSDNKPLNIKVKKTGKTKNFLGYKSELFEIYSNGKKVRDLWITSKLPLKKEIDANKAYEKRFKIEDIFVELSGNSDIEATPEYKNLLKGGKTSIMTISYYTGYEQVERVTQVEIINIAKHIFEVPAGFKKVPIEQFMQH